jgi:uncharacterized protein
VLLDINVLLALAWPSHQFHASAQRWFERMGKRWASCAITQLGFVRISSNPAFSPHAKSPAELTELLADMTKYGKHTYLANLPALAGLDDWTTIGGHKQVTDAYLALVAKHHRKKLATFDVRLGRHPELGPAVEVIAVS